MSKVSIERQKIDILANAISDKSGVPVTMTLDEMLEAVDGIEAGGGEPNLQAKTYTVDSAGTATVTADSGYDGLSEVEVSVPQADFAPFVSGQFETQSGETKWHAIGGGYAEGAGWVDEGGQDASEYYPVVPANTSVTPTESSQTIGGWRHMMEGAVTVNAIPSNYVGSGITQRSSSDLTASGATVTVPSGYYSAQASKAVASGSAGTPTATKGTVSNHSISVTPSVTNTAGYISGGTHTGTAVTVTASELASGNKAITQNGTGIDVVGYSTVSVDVAGAEYTRTVIAPQQTVSPSSAMQQMTLTSSGLIEDAKSYIVTIDNVEWLTTCETLWSSNYCIGDARYFLEASPSSTIYPFGAICEGGIIYACFATTGSHTIKIERLDFVTGGTTLTTKNITANGTYNASSDSADGYTSVTVNVPSTQPTIQSLTVTPTTSQQTFNASGVDGYKPVTVNAMPSGTAGTPTATKGSVSNHSISVTPSVTNTTGYITGSTKTGTAVTVSASELVSGSQTLTGNGTTDVTNLASVTVSIPFVTYYTGSSAPSSSLGSDGDIYLKTV